VLFDIAEDILLGCFLLAPSQRQCRKHHDAGTAGTGDPVLDHGLLQFEVLVTGGDGSPPADRRGQTAPV
jgi:hypothetical protein